MKKLGNLIIFPVRVGTFAKAGCVSLSNFLTQKGDAIVHLCFAEAVKD
jgi:hypothetical protein